jgi:Rieske Fe-S protein
MKTRRTFIKNTCTACLGYAVLGIQFSQLAGCAPLPIYTTNFNNKTVAVPLSSFVKSPLVIVRDKRVPFDILLAKNSEKEFLAIYLKCTHRENPVTATKNGLFCASHGSRFTLDGKVLKGPALKPLLQFTVKPNESNLIIDLTI